MSRVLAIFFAELLKLDLRSTLSDTNIRTIVPVAAFLTLKPDVFSFAFLFSHNKPSFPPNQLANPIALPVKKRRGTKQFKATTLPASQ